MKKIFVVHGWTYSLDKWQKLKEELSARSVELVMLNVPGLTEPSDKSWTIDEYVEWLRSKLNNVDSPIVLGHSNGGRIALAYCQKYPGHIGRLILLGSAGVPHDRPAQTIKRRIVGFLAKVGKPLARIGFIRKVFYKFIGASDYERAPENMKATMRNMLAADKGIDLGKVNLPVTLIWGDNDKSTPVGDAKTMNTKIDGSKLYIVKGAGHSPHFTHTENVTKLIMSVVDS